MALVAVALISSAGAGHDPTIVASALEATTPFSQISKTLSIKKASAKKNKKKRDRKKRSPRPRSAPSAAPRPTDGELVDDFESYLAGIWAEGHTYGSWYVKYNGYGSVRVDTGADGTRYHYQKPKASTTPDETHASMIVSDKTFYGIDMTVQQKTVEQLRTGSRPNPWEVAWVIWGYRDDLHFYYFIFKPNGIELGKVHPAYPGNQRYLYTATSPTMTIGTWSTIRVRQVGTTIDVWIDETQVIKGFVDSPGKADDQPYTMGKIGMYNEDAHVLFDNVRASSTGASGQ